MQVVRFLFILLVGIYSQWALAILPIQHWQTPSGSRVYFVESRGLPILDISVNFSAGSSADTPEKSGCASLTLHLLDLGAGGLSEDKISKALADVGAQLSAHFDRDRAVVSLRTLSSKRERDQALDILSRVIQHPEFPENTLKREKVRVIARLKEAETKPDYIANRTLMKMLYGNHPYGLRGSGEVATLNTLRRRDLVDFYQSHYAATNAVVSIMGDVSRTEAAAIAEALSKDLPQGKAGNNLPPVVKPIAGTKRITHPATQSHILLAYPGLQRDDPDYYPLLVGNYILGGGGFASRLMEEIRQKRGLAYSVRSSFYPLKQAGPFQIGLQTKKEQSEEALRITRKVLADFIAGGPTEKELVAARGNIVGGFPLRIDSNKKIMGYLALIGFYNLPLTYLDDYVSAVDKVTVEQIKEAFQRRIRPEGMVTVVVGAAEEK
ncbi:MAG: pitrilysin family protein [Nitrosomonadaceae bacterium]